MARDGLDAGEIYDRIAVRDVQLAADVLRSVCEDAATSTATSRSRSRRGFAHDTDGTLEQARDVLAAPRPTRTR